MFLITSVKSDCVSLCRQTKQLDGIHGYNPKFEKEKEDKTMKWYNFETRFLSLRDALRAFLKDNNIKYELSGAYSYYHFEIYTDCNGAEKINGFLDTQSFINVPA